MFGAVAVAVAVAHGSVSFAVGATHVHRNDQRPPCPIALSVLPLCFVCCVSGRVSSTITMPTKTPRNRRRRCVTFVFSADRFGLLSFGAAAAADAARTVYGAQHMCV